MANGKTIDICLIKSDRKIDFKAGSISPICLPDPDFTDTPIDTNMNLQAYVAGWGRTNSRGASEGLGLCGTDKFGPSPYGVCSFPFKYDEKIFNTCSKTEPPSSKHPICEQFFQWAEHKNVDLWRDTHDKSYLIKYHDQYREKTTKIRCYNPSNRFGWCGTCYDYFGKSVKRYEEGFCGNGGRKGRNRYGRCAL